MHPHAQSFPPNMYKKYVFSSSYFTYIYPQVKNFVVVGINDEKWNSTLIKMQLCFLYSINRTAHQQFPMSHQPIMFQVNNIFICISLLCPVAFKFDLKSSLKNLLCLQFCCYRPVYSYIQLYGRFFPGDHVTSYYMNLLFMNELQYLESSLHTLHVAISGQSRTSFLYVKNNLCLK